jgi:MoxR-like ATPase
MPQGPFELVRPVDFARHDRPAAHAALMARTLPAAQQDFRAAARHFQLDDDLQTAINMALAVGAPLLLTGAPGTGKTQVAYYLGEYFGIEVYDFQVKSTSTARDLKYDFDAVAYLREAQHPEPGARRPREHFLVRGPLWLAYEDARNAVVLIDEIDKAPRDFPNDLLQELDKHRFAHPFDPKRPVQAPAGRPPIVIVTSNAERRLPDAFLRRCIVHHLDLTDALVKRIVQARQGDFPALASDVAAAAIERFLELRAVPNLGKPPTTAELLAWLTILSAQHAQRTALDVPLRDLPALGALIKDRDDLGKF